MTTFENLIIFSENRETQGTYIALANLYNVMPVFKDKSKTSLQALSERTPDLIIYEILQPVMSEIEYVDQIHGLAGNAPILIVSSYFYDTKDIVFGDKIAGFVMKPFDVQKLADAIGAIPSAQEKEALPPAAVAKETKIDQIQYESKKLSVLLEISRSLNSITDFDELLHRIIVLAADTLQAERATLFLVDKKRKQLWSRTGIGIEKQEIRIPLETGIAGEVALSGVPQIISDPYSHPKFNKDIDTKTGFRTRNILCLPMRNIEGQIIGVFQILNKKDGEFTNEDQYFLNAMAGNTGIAIENALLHDEMKIQLQEVKQSYDDLYIAQNQILKETRIATFAEVFAYIHAVMKESQTIAQVAAAIKKAYGTDKNLMAGAEALHSAYQKMLSDIDSFLQTKQKELQFRVPGKQ